MMALSGGTISEQPQGELASLDCLSVGQVTSVKQESPLAGKVRSSMLRSPVNNLGSLDASNQWMRPQPHLLPIESIV